MIRKWYELIKDTGKLFFNYPVSAFAAQTTFFLIISAFPFVMLLITLIGYIPGIEQQMLQSELSRLMPGLFDEFVDKIFNEIYARQNATVISITAFSGIFAASQGFASVIRGMNLVYGIREQRNFFVVRGMSLLCTFGLMAAIIVTLGLMVFSDKLLQLIAYYFPLFAKPALLIVSFRILLIYILLAVLFLFLYLLVPGRRSRIRAELPGALLSAAGWVGFSLLYSLYTNRVNTYVYGPLTSAVFIMLWLYFCIYILFVGAEVNRYLRLRRLQFHKGE